LKKDKKRALSHLRAAAEKGFADIDALNNADFVILRDEAEFKIIGETVKKNADEKQTKS
jgi:hypothetical protein